MEASLTFRLDEISQSIEQVAREIYYALSLIKEGIDSTDDTDRFKNIDASRINLQQALNIIGVRKPEDVGLSSRALRIS